MYLLFFICKSAMTVLSTIKRCTITYYKYFDLTTNSVDCTSTLILRQSLCVQIIPRYGEVLWGFFVGSTQHHAHTFAPFPSEQTQDEPRANTLSQTIELVRERATRVSRGRQETGSTPARTQVYTRQIRDSP